LTEACSFLHYKDMDTENLRGQVVGAYEQGADAVVALVVILLGELAAQLETMSARVTSVEGENATLRTENAALRAKLGTNSHNSGKPPSSDGPGSKPHPKSQRVVSGRKPGGQPGHDGQTLALVDAPDEVREHAPSHCQGCGQSLDDVPVLRRERRQVVDIPPVRARVIAHQVTTKCCPGCATETRGTFPLDVAAPVQYGPGVATLAVYLTQEQLLPLARTSAVRAEVCGCPVTQGTVERAVADCHERLAVAAAAITQGVTAAKVAHVDETGLNIGGKTAWLHGASTPHLTCYAIHQKRGRAAMDAIGVVSQFRGRAVHAGLPSYGQYSQCAHALCNAHHLRELTFVEEHLGQGWAKNLKGLLREIKQAVDDARDQGRAALSMEAQQEFARRYDVILDEGMRANPPPPPTGKRGRPKRGKAGSLVDRLREHKAETLAFMTDFTVPFDNNQAERDIRMTKVREKISGCFRTPTGAARFCRIRGYISTLRKQEMPILSALGQAIAGTPPLPVTT
jgi:transposase